MTGVRTLDEIDVAGKRVLVRVDFNVPMTRDETGRRAVADATRIDAALETIHALRDRGARIVLLSHFGRPKGAPDPEMSLGPVVRTLSARLGCAVAFAPDCVGAAAEAAVAALSPGGVLLLENLRFHPGEEANDPDFADRLAALGEAYVNDAFSAAHRAHASTEGLAHRLPAAAGRALARELDALARALDRPERPVAAIVGGAKISTKLALLGNLLNKVDQLVIGGGMANTFLYAAGKAVGRSLCETDLADTARRILGEAESAGCEIVLPSDVVVARELAPNAASETVAVGEVAKDAMILDIGPASVADLEMRLERLKTLVWNGPLGAFETPPFERATVEVARAAARRVREGRLVAVAGGGDTVSALNLAGVARDFSYVSTAGGAFLEWMEGKTLPGVAVLPQTEREGA